jgi:hypothetical protein
LVTLLLNNERPTIEGEQDADLQFLLIGKNSELCVCSKSLHLLRRCAADVLDLFFDFERCKRDQKLRLLRFAKEQYEFRLNKLRFVQLSQPFNLQ